jgi:hypothetical protein
MIAEGIALRAQTHRAPSLTSWPGLPASRPSAISGARPGGGKDLGRDAIIIDLWQGV